MRLRASGRTDVGLARSHNEDCFEVDEDHGLFVVADGMGGHSHGEVASRVAVETIREFVRRAEDRDTTWPFPWDAELRRHSNVLEAAVRLAHDQVMKAIQRDGSLEGMGTTVVGCLVEGDTAAVAHVGDSRAYRLRADDLQLLTQDHTWVNEQVVAGYLSEAQARDHPLKNVVTRALGGDTQVTVDVREIGLEPGDTVLLCSDGLTTMLDDREILGHLADADGDLSGACDRLVDAANARGGLDNVTVVLVRAEASDPEKRASRDDETDAADEAGAIGAIGAIGEDGG